MRVAVVAGPDPGHLLPCAAIARALADRGGDVTVVSAPSWRDDLEADGLGFLELPKLQRQPRDADLGWRMWGRAADMAPDLADALRDVGTPDVVVADTLTAGGGFAAELLGRPWVEVVPHWLWAPSRALPPVGLGADPARTPLGRWHHAHLRRHQARSFQEGRAAAADARRAVGLPASGAPHLRLLATVPALEPPRPDWPPRTHVVGALPWEPPSWPVLEPPPGDGPLVLVTDSTASGIDDSLAARAVEGLRHRGLRVVATTDRPIPEGPGTVVGRSRHAPLLPAVDVAVGAGGGIVSKALGAGVPLLCVPLVGDQLETAARVARTGAGLRLDWPDATPDRIADAVLELAGDPRYRRAAARVADGARGLGPVRAAQLIHDRVR